MGYVRVRGRLGGAVPERGLACVVLVACAGCLGGPPRAPTLAALTDPTPLAKCKIAASSTSPLVTEWPASQKAHLEGLATHQAVAVAYAGCELRIVETCHLPGRYAWRRTTPASDTIEITNDDELYAKLPIGAAGLEGELARTGKLSVKTTVSGQLELEGLDTSKAPADGTCAGVTHLVSAVSVGAFTLSSGAGASAKAGATGFGASAGGSTKRDEKVMREAGDPSACSTEGDAAPRNCASPIQIFLQPFGAAAVPASPSVAGAAPAAASALAVDVDFPALEGEHWALHDAGGTTLCDTPCTRAVPPGSGWFLERSGGTARVEIPARLPHAPGSHVVADYRGERGQPLLSTLAFWGVGAPTGVLGAVGIGLGAAVSDPAVSDQRGFWIGSGIFFLAIAGASTWWYLWSHSASFDTH
jgi:hypothetical protein